MKGLEKTSAINYLTIIVDVSCIVLLNCFNSDQKKTQDTDEGKLEPTIEVIVDETNVKVTEGSPAKLQWKIKGNNKIESCIEQVIAKSTFKVIYFSSIVKKILTTYLNHPRFPFLEPTSTGVI